MLLARRVRPEHSSATMKITVLMGGTSAERDVSLASGLRIAQALRSKGHEVTSFDTARGAIDEAEEQEMLSEGVVKTAPPSLDALAQNDAHIAFPLARHDIGNTRSRRRLSRAPRRAG